MALVEKPKETQEEVPQGKYTQECSLCNKPGTDKKWVGQYWHKKCLRNVKKASKRMV